MGTKNNPGEFDCYAAAEPDESMFILLGRDGIAATAVRAWAWRYWLRKIVPLAARIMWASWQGSVEHELIRKLQQRERKHREALQCALSMDAWWLRKQLESR